MAAHFILPDLESPVCAMFPHTMNPHYEVVAKESHDWIDSFGFFADKKREQFMQCVHELLAAHCFPYAEYSQLRICCDFWNLLFAIDEVSDVQNGLDARETVNVYVRTMHGLAVDEGTKLHQATKELRECLIVGIGPQCLKRFVKHGEEYVTAVAVEAQLREEGKILLMKDFVPIRRDNSAVCLGLCLVEYCLGIDLPVYVLEDSAFQEIYWDLYSYSVELAKGISGVNFVTVVMNELGLGVQGAAEYVGEVCAGLLKQYEHGKKNLPSCDPETDAAVARYGEAIGYWLRGNVDWSFETPRYFGQDALEVERTRIVKLPSNHRDGTQNVESVV